MATKGEKLFGTILGTLAGAVAGHVYAKNHNIPKEDMLKYTVGGGIGGAACSYGLVTLFGSPNNTVNYELFKGNKRVYHGIAFEERVDPRKSEHLRSGKEFTKMICDKPKPRIEAMILEKSLIKKHKPMYNIQHNN